MEYVAQQGYEIVGHIIWVKLSRKGKLQNNLGLYLRHTKETLILAVKGNVQYNEDLVNSNIYTPRPPRNEKPDELYEILRKCYLSTRTTIKLEILLEQIMLEEIGFLWEMR